jgi:SAM-dependent methyltransferase
MSNLRARPSPDALPHDATAGAAPPAWRADRIANEVAHGRHLAASGATAIWRWEGVAGRSRWTRRAAWLCGEVLAGESVPEIGCGTGALARALADRGARVTAIDVSAELLAIARRDAIGAPVNWLLTDAARSGLAPGCFNWVVGSSVLHHLELGAALAEIFRLLAPGGRLRFTEPNLLNPQIAIQKHVKPIKRWAGDSPDESAFTRWQVAAAMRARGFEAGAVRPFDFVHPAIPGPLVPIALPIGAALERVPLVREIAGSLMIEARRPRLRADSHGVARPE